MINIGYTIYYTTYLLVALIILIKTKHIFEAQPLLLLLPLGLIVEALYSITPAFHVVYDIWDVVQWCSISLYLCFWHSQHSTVTIIFAIQSIFIGLLLLLRPILDILEVYTVMMVNLCYICMILFYLITIIRLQHKTNTLSLLFFMMLLFECCFSGINTALYSFIGKEHTMLDYFIICFLAFKCIINITIGSMVMIVKQYKQHFS